MSVVEGVRGEHDDDEEEREEDDVGLEGSRGGTAAEDVERRWLRLEDSGWRRAWMR